MQKFYFRIKLTKFFVQKLSPVGLYMAAHASTVVSEYVVCWRRYHNSPVCADVRTMAILLLEPRNHSLESGNVSSTAQRLFNTSVQLRVCSICADKKQSKDNGSARCVIQQISIYGIKVP